MSLHLSLVIPAFNEARRLPATMAELARFARESAPEETEVLLVVETSHDGTLELARQLAAEQAGGSHRWEVIDSGVQRGKGHAVRTGMLRAGGEHVIYMDADLSVPLREVHAFLRHFAEHPDHDVLVGNRQHPRSQITRAQSWLRRSMGQTFNRVLSTVALAELRDTQCGFKAFRRRACHEIFSRQTLDGFAFDVEVLLLAKKLGFRVEDLPVEWINSPESHVRLVRDSIRMLWDVGKIRWKSAG